MDTLQSLMNTTWNKINVNHCAIWFLKLKSHTRVAVYKYELFEFKKKKKSRSVGKFLGAIAYYTLHSQTLYVKTETNKVHNTLYIVERSL